MTDWYRPRETAGAPGYTVRIAPGDPGWQWTGLMVANMAAGESRTIETGDLEYIVLPLAGSFEVSEGGQSYKLAGRANVFAGASDLVFVGCDRSFVVRSEKGGRVALCMALAKAPFPTRYLAASDVPIEVRGSGRATRQVRNFGIPGVLDADSMIACEVITPAGNWSSYPPHKHDEERPGFETQLEEIFYYELQTESGAPTGEPMGYQRVYGTPDRPVEVLAEVRHGDVVLVPHGWHGPSMAPPGYDLYYLNVMAGPGEQRAWLICDDPAHAWVRQTWPTQAIDPRMAPIPASPAHR